MRDLTGAEWDEWLQRSVEHYAQSLIRSGRADPANALDQARQSFERLLPHGAATAKHRIGRVLDGVDPVAWLWLGFGDRPERPSQAFVYDIEVDEQLRGQGYGRATMVFAEGLARQAGFTEIGLNVFGYNTTARKLYESLGYELLAQQMGKQL